MIAATAMVPKPGTAAARLQREGKGLALATQRIGGGQGIATVLEAA